MPPGRWTPEHRAAFERTAARKRAERAALAAGDVLASAAPVSDIRQTAPTRPQEPPGRPIPLPHALEALRQTEVAVEAVRDPAEREALRLLFLAQTRVENSLALLISLVDPRDVRLALAPAGRAPELEDRLVQATVGLIRRIKAMDERLPPGCDHHVVILDILEELQGRKASEWTSTRPPPVLGRPRGRGRRATVPA